MNSPFAELALMQQRQQPFNPNACAMPRPVPVHPPQHVLNSWFSAPRGMAYQIINEMATVSGVKFQHTITGESGWIFKRLHVRFSLTGDKRVIEHVQNWLRSLESEKQ